MNRASDGVKSTEANYDGSWNPATAISLFKNLLYGASIKNIKIYAQDRADGYLEVNNLFMLDDYRLAKLVRDTFPVEVQHWKKAA